MAQSTTPVAGSLSRVRFAWASLVEISLVVGGIIVLLPLFARVAEFDDGRDRRFADVAIAAPALPGPVLAAICARHGALAEDLVHDRLCAPTPRLFAAQAAERVDRMPLTLANAYASVRQAFIAPLLDAHVRLDALRVRQREGLGDLLEIGDAIEEAEDEVAPYVERYRIEGGVSGHGPRPLACAFAGVDAALTYASARSGANADMARANAALLLAAALDGNAATAVLANVAVLPPSASRGACADYPLADALAAAAALVAEARSAPTAIAKNDAMRTLLRTAGWQWAAWSLAGLALVMLARRVRFAAPGIAIAIATWAAAAWIGRVPWPLGGAHGLMLGRESAELSAPPAAFVGWMLVAALVLLLASPWLRKAMACSEQAAASPLAYPGLVFATGIGWLLLLDLSANGHFGNRYLALYHQGHLWLGMLVFTALAFARQPLARVLAWTLALVDGAADIARRRAGVTLGTIAAVALTLVLIGAVGALLLNVRQFTSEIGRLWLIVGAAWFFFLRGTPLTERLAQSGGSLASLVRYVAPLVFVVAVLVGAMLITRDMGPLLIDAYGAGAFVAASIAMWWYQRRGARRSAYALAALLFVAWIVAATVALFRLGSIDDVTAARLENVAAPLASANDQLALVTWFQRAAPREGFGLGSIPWCGYGTSVGCAGVPAQIQSDYTFTAVVGAFGWTGAWTLTLGCAAWLHLLIRRHSRATRGEPRFVRRDGRIANDEQALLSWLCVAWVVLALCQLAVTVAGNLAVIPLTGVTFPFVSFGMTSLVVNMAMLALAIDVNVSRSPHDG